MKEHGVLYIHTQIPDPNSAWSHASFVPLTSQLIKSAVSFLPVPHLFSPESLYNVPPEV